jgi:hypothetical protein
MVPTFCVLEAHRNEPQYQLSVSSHPVVLYDKPRKTTLKCRCGFFLQYSKSTLQSLFFYLFFLFNPDSLKCMYMYQARKV